MLKRGNTKMPKNSKYWNEKYETKPYKEREKDILKKIKAQLNYVYTKIPFYRSYYKSKGFHPDQVKTLEDFTKKVPIIKKQMLRDDQVKNPPYGSYLGIKPEQVYRIHGSSGTTGKPTIYGISKKDWDRIAEVHSMCYYSAGMKPTDTVQVSMLFSLFLGGWGALQAADNMGCHVFPIGAGQTEKQVKLMFEQIYPTVLTCTPTYALHMAEVAQEMGYDTEDSSLKLGVFLGEPGAGVPSVKKKIGDTWGIEVIDCGSTSEMTPWSTNCECTEHLGMHTWNDVVYTEVVDMEDPSEGPFWGEEGAVVYTHLERESQPMIRFWAGDRTFMVHPDEDPCPCGRTFPRLPRGIYGRIDDMLVIRGVNVYPSTIEEGIRMSPGAGLEFRIVVTRPGTMDQVELQVEYNPEYYKGKKPDAKQSQELMKEIKENVKQTAGISTKVTLVAPESLERTVHKARRVIDKRTGVWTD
jgi:phenylacetate-CoA ligase